MAESLEGGLVMGHALPKKTSGTIFHVPAPTRPLTWHHDWRGKLYSRFLYAAMVSSAGLALWYLTPLHTLVK